MKMYSTLVILDKPKPRTLLISRGIGVQIKYLEKTIECYKAECDLVCIKNCYKVLNIFNLRQRLDIMVLV